jgi:hypothetical protein
MQPPVPPKFQPEPVRAPQAEGNQSMPPPASLALPDVPAQAMPALDKPTIALTSAEPRVSTPSSVAPVRAEAPAAPPVPELQAIPLPAQVAPTVNLKTSVSVSAPSIQRELPQVQAPALAPAEAQLEAVPVSQATRPNVASVAPTLEINVADKASTAAVQTSISRPELSTQPAQTSTNQPDTEPSSPSQSSQLSSKSAADASATGANSSPASSKDQSSNSDVSAAPNATPQGSDTATPGEHDGMASAADASGKQGSQPSQAQGQGSDATAKASGKTEGAGKSETGATGTIAQAGAAQGEKQGEIGSYVQVTPHGDTQIMDHGSSNVRYKATRFDKDWTPLGESSVDTALRHAVEKATATHTFHLPEGVHIKCELSPLVLGKLLRLGCGNGTPPPAPLADKAYDRMHLPPAKPLAPPPASSTAEVAKAAPITLDNSAECSAARISGGPPPPGCASIILPVKLAHPASSSSTSWVPASDQFH